MLTCLIIDDELHARETLQAMLTEFCNEVEVLGMADSADAALQLLKETRPDLVFLDVEMPGGSGFHLLEQAEGHAFHTIFTTAHEHYAIQAIKYRVSDYLLKPIEINQLEQSIDRVRTQVSKNTQQYQERAFELYRRFQLGNITLPVSHGYEMFPLADIIYLKADGNYTEFYIADQNRVMVSKHLKEFESMLPEQYFVRAHRSYLINLSHVRSVKYEGSPALVMSDGSVISVARRQRGNISAALKNFNL